MPIDKERRVQYQPRDYKALATLADVRAMRMDDMARLLAHFGDREKPLHIRTTRDIQDRWLHEGHITTHRNLRGGLGLIAITRKGVQNVKHEGTRPIDTPVGLPAWRDLPHDLTVAAVATTLICSHYRWRGVATVRAEAAAAAAAGTHLPDGVAVKNGVHIACEIERTAKSASRWQDNIGYSLSQWHQVAYFASPTVTKSLAAWANLNLAQSDRARVHIRPIAGDAR